MAATRQFSPNSFDISQPSLADVLERIHVGEIRLPSFARDWCWSVGDIQSLLETIGYGHPMGFATLVDGTAADHRSFEAVPIVQNETRGPVHLLLDGQQRLTAVYQSCYDEGVVQTKTSKGARYHRFFLDIEKAINAAVPIRDALFSIEVGADGRLLRPFCCDYTLATTQYERCVVPTSALLSFESYELGFKQYWSEVSRRTERDRALETISDFRETVVAAFERYKMPLQIVTRPMSKADLCSAYMQLNGHG